ncbi:MAG: S41 family peptidase [Chitinophagales bacterium]
MDKRIIAAVLVLCLFTASCEKLFLDKDPANDPVSNFESLWETLDKKYSFFELKNINWDSVYTIYRPQIHDDMNNIELFNVLADMLFVLKDGHVNLIAPFNISRNWTWYLDYAPNYNSVIVLRNYLGENHFITGPLRNQVIDSVGFIDYRSFANPVSESNLDFVLLRFRHLKGIIIDVRDNGGGSPSNAFKIAARFTDKRRHVFSTLLKNGPNHNDFTEANKVYIEPEGDFRFTGKVIVLCNRKSFSATNDFLSIMSVLPNVIIVGDTSGGGGGSPTGYELPNGWAYRFSATQTLLPNGWNTELGIPPDIRVDMDPAKEANGIDAIIERALDKF